MEPITLTAIAVGIFLNACGTRPYNGAVNTSDPDTTNNKDTTVMDAFVSADSVSLPADVDDYIATPEDTFVGPETIVDITTDIINKPSPCPTFPLKGNIKLFAQSPCGAGANITDLDDTGFGICTDFDKKNMVFQFGETGIINSATLSITPDQVELGSNGELAITGLNLATQIAGTLRLPSITAAPTWVPFEPVIVNQQTFLPSFPKGLAYLSGNLFVATGNISFATGSSVYSPGTVLAYLNNQTQAQTLPSQGQNPTSMSTLSIHGQPMLAVINTGNYNIPTSNPDNKGSLIIIDPATQQIAQTIQLPRAGFGLSGEIAIGGEKLAIGSAENSGQTIVYQFNNFEAGAQLVPSSPAPTGESHFLTTTILSDDGKYLVSGDYNSGKLKTWDISGATPQEVPPEITLDTDAQDNQNLGDGFCKNGKLYIVVGTNIMELQ